MVALVCALAVVATGALVATPLPARADQTVTSGGAVTVTWPGGDMVATYDAAGVDPASAQDFVTTLWPKGVGLSPGASLSDLFQATWRSDSGIVAPYFPDPPTFDGGSITVASDGSGGSTITVDIPAADVQANQLPAWLRGVLAQVAGALASVTAFGLCAAALIASSAAALVTTGPAGTLVLTALGGAFCSGMGAASWTLVATIVGQWLAGGPFDADFWWGALGATLAAFVGGAVLGPVLTPVFTQAVVSTLNGIGRALSGIIRFVSNWVAGGSWDAVAAGVARFFARVVRLFRSRMPALDPELGGVAPVASGEFELLPLPDVGEPFAVPLCMDAYGAAGGSANPGQAVAINACDGSANQDFDYYPNGAIGLYGLCVAPGGGTSSIGSPLVTLEPCDGSSDEQWTQSGGALVNQAGGGCLDDPNLDTAAGTQLDLYPCNGSQAQNWRKPVAEPCDIYAAHNTGCVAAYATTRAMYADYDGPLYQVKRGSDGTTKDIGLLSAGGIADASQQDSFCAKTTCIITEIYDQSPAGNDLTIAGPGGASGQDQGAVADALPIKVGGKKAYGVDIEPSTGYRNNTTLGVATDGQPEGMYMVASGTHVNDRCCFDFGNAEANSRDTGDAHMDAVTLTTTCYFAPCSGSGPWVQADLENGLFQGGGNGSNLNNKGNKTPFVTAMLGNNGQDNFSLNGGDSTSGGLSTWWNGSLPTGYAPMKQEGGIILGTGGDNSNWDVGSWFEGVMTAGDPSQAAADAVQANIVSAGYSGSTDPAGASTAPSAAGPAVVHAAGATGAAHAGYSSVFTVTSGGDLQESYLPAMGDDWSTQNLSAKYGTPTVMPGTQPVALVHCGFTSVYTVDAASGDLQETYLQAIGGPWKTQDLSVNYGTPSTAETPTAVVHSAGASGATDGCGYTSVYTVNRNGHLQETYLPNAGFPGDPWHTQDLSVNYGAPAVEAGTSPVALVHCGFTSVYTVDGNQHLQETYLPSIGGPWKTQDLSVNYGTPSTTTTPTAVVHSAGASGATDGCGYTSVYTVDASDNHLQETYLPNAGFPGDPWHTQDLSANYGAPAVAADTAPVALVHMGFTSVYTVDQGSNHLQETYLQAIGGPWKTQDLSVNYGTPSTVTTPIVLLHPDTGGNLDWTSVYTIDQFSDHLQETYLPNAGFPGDPWVTQDLSAKYGTPPDETTDTPTAGASAVHSGYTSLYSVDSSGNLWETYLTAMGQPWHAQNLSAEYGTPKVMDATAPVALTHDGYTSVYTVDAKSGHLQETYLPAIGDGWSTQDLSDKFGTPASTTTPTAAFHDGYTSVYTTDGDNGDLWETYLPGAGFPGDPWHSQNLSAKYGTPSVDAFTSPVAVTHDGYTSVYTIDAVNEHLQETYLPAMGDDWSTQDLSAKYGTPAVNILSSPTAVVHDGYVSVYTIDANGDDTTKGHLQETYLPAMGDAWATQDLSAKYGAPQPVGGIPLTALHHTGYTSVYSVDPGSFDLQETYLPAMGDDWSTQDLSAKYGTPPTQDPLAALLHYDTAGGLTWTSVFTADRSSGDLQETYLPAIGDGWTTQNLTGKYGAPHL
ncbi:arabinofuranosidase catalytic domain-containing protein [Actinacidiphila alni]|nr:arabinofuranosidase catalytic domain-containing protein [Actinacidiphila alni]